MEEVVNAGDNDMPTKRKKLNEKLRKIGISKKNLDLSASPKTKRVLDKLKKRK